MLEDDDVEIEFSPLCGKLKCDGTEIEILIYRTEGSTAGWSLEVVDEEDGSTVWDDLFDTDQAAMDEVMRTIEEEGISVFLRSPDELLH